MNQDGQLPVTEQQLQHGEVMQKPRNRIGLWVALIFLTVVLAACAAGYYLFFINQFSLSVIMLGEENLVLEYGDHYQEPGAKVVFVGTKLWKDGIASDKMELRIETDLREEVLGSYSVNYLADFYGWEATACRNIRVVDTQSPVITLVDESDETILPGQHYVEEGFSAHDNYDGDITGWVRTFEDMGVITYVAVDSSGNLAYAQREIPYYDPVPPEIHLREGEYLSISAGTYFIEPGYTAEDNADGDITEKVTVEGDVVWYQPGKYPITYSVTDIYGNETVVIRTVEVTAVPRPEIVYPQRRTIFLTFDDGPGSQTGKLLDVLKKYGVKATFFVTDTGYNAMMARIVREGHSIGIHSRTHDYGSIYFSPESFFEDLYGMQEIIYQNTGVKTTLMRFPGGGSNLVSRFNPGIMTILTEAVQDAGFQYFDWNVDSMDAGGAKKREDIVKNVTEYLQKQPVSVVLQHDIHDYSVDAVEEIILWGLNRGYEFQALNSTSPGFHHTVLN